MSDASKAAFGEEAILPIFSSQKIPTVAPVMTSPSFIACSGFFFTSRCCHLVLLSHFPSDFRDLFMVFRDLFGVFIRL